MNRFDLVRVILPLLWTIAVAADAAVVADESSFVAVHVVPHSHCDAGWIQTVNEYDTRTVRSILSALSDALTRNPNRRFVWAESIYLSRWYESISDDEKQKFAALVRRGAIEFVGGGWVQHDEAITTADAILDQLMAGLQYLKDKFQVLPTNAWQIDVFGSSPVTAWLFKKLGFQNLVTNRVDYHVEDQMKHSKNMEFIWESQVGDEIYQTYTHIMGEHYSAPKGFDFEGSSYENPTITEYNIHERALEFIREIRRRRLWYRTPNLLIPFGDDFKFVNAEAQFENMDKIISYINSPENSHRKEFRGITIKYSTLNEYFASVKQYNEDKLLIPSYLKLRMTDFFPYLKRSYPKYYSGFYSSRPQLKLLTRKAQYLLHSLEMMVGTGFISKLKSKATLHASFVNLIHEARQNISILQHHDAITGTSTNHVNDDYVSILKATMARLSHMICLYELYGATSEIDGGDCPHEFRILNIWDHVDHPVLATDKAQYLSLLNTQPWNRVETISLRITQPYVVVTCSGTQVQGQVLPFKSKHASTSTHRDTFTLVFEVVIAGFDYAYCYLAPTKSGDEKAAIISTPVPVKQTFFENQHYRVDFDSRGILKSIKNRSTGRSISVRLEVFEYSSGRHDEQYLFDPLDQTPQAVALNSSKSLLYDGPVVQEIYLDFGTQAEISIRLVKTVSTDPLSSSSMVEVRVVSRPNLNTDLVVRMTPLSLSGTFATDLNGLVMLDRQDPGAQNGMSGRYFPMTSLVSLTFEKSPLQAGGLSGNNQANKLDVYSTRSFGTTGFCHNETLAFANCIEIMTHRRTSYSHSGSIEPLDDDFISSDVFHVSFGPQREIINSKSTSLVQNRVVCMSHTEPFTPKGSLSLSASLMESIGIMDFHILNTDSVGFRIRGVGTKDSLVRQLQDWTQTTYSRNMYETDLTFRQSNAQQPLQLSVDSMYAFVVDHAHSSQDDADQEQLSASQWSFSAQLAIWIFSLGIIAIACYFCGCLSNAQRPRGFANTVNVWLQYSLWRRQQPHRMSAIDVEESENLL